MGCILTCTIAGRELRCASCNALNRIKRYSLNEIPRCGRCQAALPEATFTRARRALRTLRPSDRTRRALLNGRTLAGFAIVASLLLVGLRATLTNGTANLDAVEHRAAS